MKKALAIALLLGAALAASSCSGSSDPEPVGTAREPASSSSSSVGRPDPAATAREFLDALAAKDAAAFCGLTLPSIRRPNFATAKVLADGGCAERAEEMFAYRRPNGAELFWELAKQAKLGSVSLHCRPRRKLCPTATVMLEDLPIRGGGKISAPLPLVLKGDRWLVGTP